MGLDVALGVVILIAAIRGWLQGFVYQAIRIAGLVACVYLATPVRDQAKPHVISYIPKIQPEFVDRGLWWAAAALTYVVLVGVTTLAIKMTRRPEIPGLQQSSRNDQFAGFLVGAAKGVLVAAFMTAGIQKYALAQLATITWADQQVKTSMALRWNEQFQPATKIWTAPPVQHFVGRIQRMGLQDPADGNGKPDEAWSRSVRSSRPQAEPRTWRSPGRPSLVAPHPGLPRTHLERRIRNKPPATPRWTRPSMRPRRCSMRRPSRRTEIDRSPARRHTP